MGSSGSQRARGGLPWMQVGAALLLFLLGGPSASAAQTPEQVLEATLLHRPIALTGLKVYSRERKTWQPLRRPTARVVVVNLWARSCPPCLAELPEFAKLVADWKQKDKAGVQFLFIADPPEQTSAAEVASFWTAPLVDELAGRCPGTRMPHGSRASCLVAVPDSDPVRADSDSLTRAVGSETRPLTLLLDEQGTVRQVFAGALAGRGAQLNGAIERLLAAVRGRAVLSARHSGP